MPSSTSSLRAVWSRPTHSPPAPTASNSSSTIFEQTVKFLYPFIENWPLVAGNAEMGYDPIPRVPANGGTATHWKTVTGIDINGVAGGVGRGQRAAAMAIQTNDLVSPYYGMGVEVPVDFETRYEGTGLVPEALAIAAQSGLRALMIREEQMIIGGNSSLALGTTPTPSVSDGASSGGTMSQGGSTLSVICVALTRVERLKDGPPKIIAALRDLPLWRSRPDHPYGTTQRRNLNKKGRLHLTTALTTKGIATGGQGGHRRKQRTPQPAPKLQQCRANG